MEVVQKKGKIKYTFSFEQDKLNYAYEESTEKGDIDLYYGDLSKKSSEFIEQNEWLRNVGLLWIVIGVFQSVYGSITRESLYIDLMWILIGAACLAWSVISKVTYTIYKTDNARLHIIHDKQHDAIVNELMSRRKAQLLAWYADVNVDNDLTNEINKFKWLAEQEVLTEEESKQKIEEAKFYHQQQGDEERVLN
ncbi:hypothetical protein [Vibrio neptunius]|uniref:SMODS and SLOG-associating 2TM effector domain-containing protein n=1 Tax=Vibrio neptunius TaxID=170651 RepID=A0ABS3A8V8_9VIBR|nr:hypothetical protein [Vibrio neptunius]MBN3495445.1 hypothetical protein [Vibrio neptunius]MBN3517948.1 hypothetical protein [Vibrio neptunius]MBN3552288.1 hypothetical protein [Vibrio neptunius]MBN3580291.1 hypothetical protein [Vibrio neptunius]MCH9873957.1 hypothetical protein [Vibrio neptunius]